MSEQGLLDGLRKKQWRDYDPELSAFSSATSLPAQLSNPTGTNFARYYQDPSGLTFIRYRFAFDANTTFPSGDDLCAVRLPFPANRATGGADLVGGNAQIWAGSSASPQWSVPIRPSLMDPVGFGPYGGKSGMEDFYIQFFVPYNLSSGTGSIASAATSTTITHNLASTPQAFDIQIVPTATTTNNIGLWFVNTIGATTFQVNVKAAPGSGGFNFNWKIREDPNGSSTFDVLMNHARPFVWASGTEISGNFMYETQV